MTVLLLGVGAGLTYFITAGPAADASGQAARLDDLIDEEKRVQWVVIHGEPGAVENVYLLSYEPLSNRFSAVYLDGDNRIVSSGLGGMHRLSEVANQLSPDEVRRDLAGALEIDLPFWIRTRPEDLSYLVDVMGGVRLELLSPPEGDSPAREPRRTERWVDGSMAHDYASTAYEEYDEQGRRYRHKTLFLSMLRWSHRHEQTVRDSSFLKAVHDRVETNLTLDDLERMADVMVEMQETKVKFPGPLRLKTVDDQSGVVGPKTVENMFPKPLRRIIRKSEPQEEIQVQVLNGAGVANLGGVVRDFLQPREGIDVVEVGNAERFNYETTQIIDRSNNPQSADRIRDILGSGQIVSEPSDRLLVDVTVIAGHDLKRMINTRS